MMKGLAVAPEPAARPGAAAALDVYAREQLSTRLKYVFGRIDKKGDNKIDAEELAEMLVELGCTPRKKKKGDRETVMEASGGVAAPEDMIWEVDEDGDGYVSWEEYLSAYERAAADTAGVEPRKLSTLIEFLLLDEEENNWISVDAIVNLMVMRLGTECPDKAIRAMFGDDGSEATVVRKITFQEFVDAGSLSGSGAKTRRRSAQKLLTR